MTWLSVSKRWTKDSCKVWGGQQPGALKAFGTGATAAAGLGTERGLVGPQPVGKGAAWGPASRAHCTLCARGTDSNTGLLGAHERHSHWPAPAASHRHRTATCPTPPSYFPREATRPDF